MDYINTIINKVHKTILNFRLLVPGEKVVVAVSGGPDSVCLLDILSSLRDELRVELVVAHLDHGLRPGEDEEETRFVASLAAQRKLPFHARRVQLDTVKGSLEERAREARYRFLEEARARFSAQKIALGHHCDDQAETVLLRLLRGSGAGGLSGMAPMREGKFIRPLLELRRCAIENYLKERKLPFKIDPTNRDDKFLRNRIRSELIPTLEEYQPRVTEILAQTAGILREENQYLETVSREWLKKHKMKNTKTMVEISRTELMSLHQALRKRIIRRCVHLVAEGLAGLSLRHIKAVERLAAGGKPQGAISLPRGVLVERVYDHLVFKTGAVHEVSDYLCMLKGPGRFVLEELSSSVVIEELPRANVSLGENQPWMACLDARKARYPLMLRNFRPGDAFVPLGMRGHKKVKDFFIDRKVPKTVRSRVPILLSGGEILWICGMMIDDRFKVTSGTEKILKIEFVRPPAIGNGREGRPE